MRVQVLQLDQARLVQLELGVAPGYGLAQGAPAEVQLAAPELLPAALGADVLVHQLEQAPRLRRQLVQAAPEHVVRDAVGQRDVGELHLDVLDAPAAPLGALHAALMLVHEGDGVDEGEVLLVIAPQPRGLVGEGQELRIGVEHVQRPKQALGVLVQRGQRLAFAVGEQAFERAPGALALAGLCGLAGKRRRR